MGYDSIWPLLNGETVKYLHKLLMGKFYVVASKMLNKIMHYKVLINALLLLNCL